MKRSKIDILINDINFVRCFIDKIRLNKIQKIRKIRDNINNLTNINEIKLILKRYPDFVFCQELHLSLFCQCKNTNFIITSNSKISFDSNRILALKKANEIIYSINIQNLYK